MPRELIELDAIAQTAARMGVSMEAAEEMLADDPDGEYEEGDE